MIILKHRLNYNEQTGIHNHLAHNIPYKLSLKDLPYFGKVLSITSIPSKMCPGNCIHCTFGKTTCQTVDRQSFYALRHNSTIIKAFIDQHNDLDYIEISGPGEVGLNAELNLLIDDIRKATNIPVHIDSCGYLCWRISVHNDFCKADAVSVRIDTADREMYHNVNAVHQQIPFERYINGIRQFRSNFKGDFYVKTCLVDGVNTDDASIYKLNVLLKSLSPDSIFVSSNQVHYDNKVYPVLDHDRLVALSTRLGPHVVLPDITHQCACFSLNNKNGVLIMSETLNIKTENVTVRLYKQSGELARVICAGAVSAEIRSDEIFVTMQGEKQKVYSVRGFFKRNA